VSGCFQRQSGWLFLPTQLSREAKTSCLSRSRRSTVEMERFRRCRSRGVCSTKSKFTMTNSCKAASGRSTGAMPLRWSRRNLVSAPRSPYRRAHALTTPAAAGWTEGNPSSMVRSSAAIRLLTSVRAPDSADSCACRSRSSRWSRSMRRSTTFISSDQTLNSPARAARSLRSHFSSGGVRACQDGLAAVELVSTGGGHEETVPLRRHRFQLYRPDFQPQPTRGPCFGPSAS